MKFSRILLILTLVWVLGWSNPIMIKVINEFQAAPETAERIEFKWFQTPSSDTSFDPHDLYGVSIITPAGTAVIDTHLILPRNGFAVIDTGVLSGAFDLPDSAGYIKASQGWRDTVLYPSEVPTPVPGASAAFFYVYYYNPTDGFSMHGDWYVDATPTFGTANDNYPGCIINGFVFDAQSQPINGAQIVVHAGPFALPKPPFYQTCTTYTTADGSYGLDSLLPFCYWVKVSNSFYYPDSYYTPFLRSRTPTMVNFYLTGITGSASAQPGTVPKLSIIPNPFYTTTRICWTAEQGLEATNKANLRIYDASGRLISAVSSLAARPAIIFTWDGTDQAGQPVPAGVYFAQLETPQGSIIEKIIKMK